MKSKQNILICGGITIDYLFSTHQPLHFYTPGSKTSIPHSKQSLGGGGANVARHIAKLNTQATLHGAIGCDIHATWARNELSSHPGLTLRLAQLNLPTGHSFIHTSFCNNDRTIFSYRGANDQFVLDSSTLPSYDLVYASSLPKDQYFKLSKHLPPTIQLACNPNMSILQHTHVASFLQRCTYLTMNKEEFTQLCSTLKLQGTFPQTMQHVHSYGIQYIAITDGSKGAWASDGSELIHQPAITQERAAINTLGAGDAFFATFVYMLLQGHSLTLALWCASIQAHTITTQESSYASTYCYRSLLALHEKHTQRLITKKKA